jgi:Tol biopolymer transport system component
MRAGACVVAVGALLLIGSGAAAAPSHLARLVVFTQYRDNGYGEDDDATLYVARLGSQSARRLTDPCVDCSDDARWSPDGSLLAYDGYGADNEGGVFLMRADGTGKRRLCGQPGQPDYLCSIGGYPAWSPDGKTVAFALGHSEGPNGRARGGGIATERVDRTGYHAVPRTRGYAVTGLDWSPDGKRFAFEADFGAVDVVRADGTGARRIEGEAVSPRWSPDGNRLVFTSANYNTPGLFVATRSGRVTKLLGIRAYSVGWWSNDHLFYALGNGLYVYDLRSHRAERVGPVPDVCRGRGLACGSFEVQPSRTG